MNEYFIADKGIDLIQDLTTDNCRQVALLKDYKIVHSGWVDETEYDCSLLSTSRYTFKERFGDSVKEVKVHIVKEV